MDKDLGIHADKLPLHKQLRLKRLYQEKSQSELAEMFNMGGTMLCEIETGKRNIPWKYRKAVEEYLYDDAQ